MDDHSVGSYGSEDSQRTSDSMQSMIRATGVNFKSNASLFNTKTGDLIDSKPIFEVDYIGNGSFRVSQMNILAKRSIEPFKSSESQLSARGLHHRSKEVFVKEVLNASNTIENMLRGVKIQTQQKPSPQLFQPHFQRALANERIQNIDQAIKDYTICIRINEKASLAYFNRSGLYRVKKNYTTALEDLNKAIELEPGNMDFRNCRARLCRECGNFEIAVKDTITLRAVQKKPELKKTLQLGGRIDFDNQEFYESKLAEDPILTSLAIPPADRTSYDLEPIKDFLKNMKIFAGFAQNSDILSQIANKVELKTYHKGMIIFEEGDIGQEFFMILDGEVSIVKMRKQKEEIVHMKVLVKLYRGQSFGETALESQRGKRTAGAIASQVSKLLLLHVDSYQSILSRFRATLKEEVKSKILASDIFMDWDDTKVDYLASFVIVKNFSANSEVIKAGETVPSLMMIKSGLVSLIKPMPKQANSQLKKSSTGAIVMKEQTVEMPGLWILNKTWSTRLDDATKEQATKAGNTEQVEFVVAVLGSGEVFGELAVLDTQQPSPVTAIATTAVELYCFESDILMSMGARFAASTMKSLMETLTLHDPPMDKVGYFYRQKYDWELRKDKLMSRLKTAASK